MKTSFASEQLLGGSRDGLYPAGFPAVHVSGTKSLLKVAGGELGDTKEDGRSKGMAARKTTGSWESPHLACSSHTRDDGAPPGEGEQPKPPRARPDRPGKRFLPGVPPAQLRRWPERVGRSGLRQKRAGREGRAAIPSPAARGQRRRRLPCPSPPGRAGERAARKRRVTHASGSRRLPRSPLAPADPPAGGFPRAPDSPTRLLRSHSAGSGSRRVANRRPAYLPRRSRRISRVRRVEIARGALRGRRKPSRPMGALSRTPHLHRVGGRNERKGARPNQPTRPR